MAAMENLPDPRFQHPEYIVRKRMLVLLGSAIDIVSPGGAPVLFCQQKAFRLREDIRIYSDQSKSEELLWIQARQILDFSGAYDVTWSPTGEHLGTLRRRGWRSMVRDLWELTDAQGNVIATLEEDQLVLALLRRLLSDLIPQSYDLRLTSGHLAAEVKQFFNPFLYKGRLVFWDQLIPGGSNVDRRLILAATMLLVVVEGRESS
jgi:hypothetical protein